ncbi:KamA family radical SAM protein [Candidatus Woesearchaeota archaeon]|nr:KamA family radical SAM protein [Candidatus Woesearchaeota archaeon]
MNLKEFCNKYPEVVDDIQKVKRVYPMKLSEYYLGLIKEKGDAIWKQCIPDIKELEDSLNDEDPLLEEEYTPVPCLVHRYPDRVLLLASNKCAMYCRFCTRKRKVGKEVTITKEMISSAIDYIRQHKEVRDVIISGGDPLMLDDDILEWIIKGIREIKHVEIIRIGTRVPCTLPSRITPELVNMLKKYHPLFVNVHFEHPAEITEESKKACELLADAGIPLNNQAVLLKGVNDDVKVLKELFHKLIQIRVKPYYLYQADQVKGTEHFRTTIEEGIDIMHKMIGFTSGMCVPQFIVDAPGGGKIPLLPEYAQHRTEESLFLKNFEGKIVEYKNPLSIEVKKKSTSGRMRIAVVFNMKKEAAKNMPEDAYAEFDEITVPLAIKKALEKKGHVAELVEANESFVEKIKQGDYDFVFNIAEGLNSGARESQIPAILDMLGIPYTGSGVLTQAITLDKTRTKEILMYHGVPTPGYQLFNHWDEKISKNITFPLIIKPNAEGSSKGIRNNSLVNNEKELRKMVKFVVNNYKQAALAEEYLEGREFTVSIIGNNPPKVLPIVEITFDYLPSGVHKFDSYEVKWYWDNPTNPVDPVVCPAKIDDELRKKIEDVALRAYKALGIVDLCRMDMRLDKQGTPHVIDVNALPGLMPDPLENSRFPKACYTAGMSYEKIINTVLSEAMKRYGLPAETKRLKHASRNSV